MNQESHEPTKWKKRLAKIALGSAIFAGTYFGRYGDLPPFYANKVRTSGGICVALYTHIDKDATFYGPITSVYTNNEGKVNGIIISLASENQNKINGVTTAVWNMSNRGKINGLELSLFNIGRPADKYDKPCMQPTTLNGIQLGFINQMSENSHGIQLGIYNEEQQAEGKRKAIIINTSPIKRKNHVPASQPSTQATKEKK